MPFFVNRFKGFEVLTLQFPILHRLSWSRLQQCKHYPATLWYETYMCVFCMAVVVNRIAVWIHLAPSVYPGEGAQPPRAPPAIVHTVTQHQRSCVRLACSHLTVSITPECTQRPPNDTLWRSCTIRTCNYRTVSILLKQVLCSSLFSSGKFSKGEIFYATAW